jgi:hypothetical protein
MLLESPSGPTRETVSPVSRMCWNARASSPASVQAMPPTARQVKAAQILEFAASLTSSGDGAPGEKSTILLSEGHAPTPFIRDAVPGIQSEDSARAPSTPALHRLEVFPEPRLQIGQQTAFRWPCCCFSSLRRNGRCQVAQEILLHAVGWRFTCKLVRGSASCSPLITPRIARANLSLSALHVCAGVTGIKIRLVAKVQAVYPC